MVSWSLSYRKSGIDGVLLPGKLVISQSPGLLLAPLLPTRMGAGKYRTEPLNRPLLDLLFFFSSPFPFQPSHQPSNLPTFTTPLSSPTHLSLLLGPRRGRPFLIRPPFLPFRTCDRLYSTLSRHHSLRSAWCGRFQ